jgi:hypothetical protein
MKKLFILVSDGGDGSYYPQFTMNQEWIDEMIEKDNNGELEYDNLGCDGDGFHFETLTVPAECTLESLGISHDCAK